MHRPSRRLLAALVAGLATAAIVALLPLHRARHAIAAPPGMTPAGNFFSPDGRRLAIVYLGSATGESIHLFDTATGRRVAALPRSGGLADHVAFSPDGRWAAAGDRRGRLRVWDAETGALHAECDVSAREHGEFTPALAFTSAGELLVCDATQRVMRRADTWAPVHDVAPGPGTREVQVWRADAGNLAVVSEEAATRVTNLASGQAGGALPISPDHGLTGVAISADGTAVVARELKKKMLPNSAPPPRVWNSRTGTSRQPSAIADATVYTLSADGRWLLARFHPGPRWIDQFLPESDGLRTVIDAIDLADGDRARCTFEGATNAAFAPDGESVAVAHVDDTVRTYDFPPGKRWGVILLAGAAMAVLVFQLLTWAKRRG